MAPGPLSDAELAQLDSWPAEIAQSDLAAYFTLSVEDLRWLRSFRSSAAVRLGLAVQCCALGFLGFVPADVAAAPAEVTARLARRVGVSPVALGRYAAETAGRSRREHVEMVVAHAGWRSCGRGEWKALGDWLVARAVEHDTPSVLFRQALEHLRAERIVRPGLDRLARAVATAGWEPTTRRIVGSVRPWRASPPGHSTPCWSPTRPVGWHRWSGSGMGRPVRHRSRSGGGGQAHLPARTRGGPPRPEHSAVRAPPSPRRPGPALHPSRARSYGP
ncbi:MAG: DUF4158 domain-containing protein [Actinomycetota bacterium]|nr:DUF4158 domain-containing protein [Actinomycetota bacterium]